MNEVMQLLVIVGCRGSVELVQRGKIEFNYHTAFGVAALAPLAVGHALVLILAGEKVCRSLCTAQTRNPFLWG